MMPSFSALENAEPNFSAREPYKASTTSMTTTTTKTMMLSVCNSELGLNHGEEMGGSSSSDLPFEKAYKNLLANESEKKNTCGVPVVEEGELPLIDLKQLATGEEERQACKKMITRASREWGFFQIINHGVPLEIMETMRTEQVKLFKKPFEEKKELKELNLRAGSYRWGSPAPTSLEQLSWSEAFHVHLNDVFSSSANNTTLRSSMEEFAVTVSELATKLTGILAEEMGIETELFKESTPTTSYLRLNRYPPCPTYSHIMGLMPHTDSSFLTVLHQDHVGGLQLVREGNWIAVKPNPLALIINIGDLLQAWSNDVYRSVEHRVVANPVKERFSTAYFFCPPNDTVIESGGVYRSFSFGEYKKQTKVDVQSVGQKVGLQRFLLPSL